MGWGIAFSSPSIAWWTPRRLYIAVFLLCTGALVMFVLPWATTRDVEVRAHFHNAGSAWRLDWVSGDSAARNGHWIDLAERLPSSGGTFSTAPDRPLIIRVRAATNALDDFALAW